MGSVVHRGVHRGCEAVPPRSGDRWFIDETYVKAAGRRAFLYPAVNQYGQVINVLLSARRDLAAARPFFTRALRASTVPSRSPPTAPRFTAGTPRVGAPARHAVEQHANNPIETGHGRLKAQLRPICGQKRCGSARPSPWDTASFRTCAEATTASPPRPKHGIGSASPSTKSRSACEYRSAMTMRQPAREGTTQQCPAEFTAAVTGFLRTRGTLTG